MVETQLLETEIYRVARPPDPWAWIDWIHANKNGTFGCRWDDSRGSYRVLYACSQRVGAFVEVLAHFQPDPAIIAENETIELVEGDDETIPPGVVATSWCRQRMITKGVATEVAGSFVVIGATATLAELRPLFAGRALHYGLPDLDGASIRVAAPRAFTQELSTFVEQQRDASGEPYAGNYHHSRHGDDIENWAIFERPSMDGKSPVLSIEREAIDPEDEDLHQALALLKLELRN
ncbi:MAG: RES domain-containing protein [Gaiellales bacterium]